MGVTSHLECLLETTRIELLQGTLDLLILRTLQPGPAHGHAIAKAIERISDDVLQVEQGSLYPGAASPDQARLDRRRRRHLREQPPRQVLSADAEGPQAAHASRPASGTSWPAPSRASCIRARRSRHDPPHPRPRRSRSRDPRSHRRRDRGQHRARHVARTTRAPPRSGSSATSRA